MVCSRVVGFFEKVKAFGASVLVHVICGVLAGIVFTFALWSLMTGDAMSMVTFLCFNLFFVFLSFSLEGSLKRKLILLISGSCLYLLLDRILGDFSMSLGQFYRPFERFYVILGPFVNMIWIVSFWSFGLTFLAGSRKQGVSSEIDR